MTTPNMNLTLPVVSTTPGPAWANQINADLSTIDAHNHTPGNGVAIPSAALNIDADLPFNGHNATLLNASQYIDQAGVLPTDFVSGTFVSGTELWFRDGSGSYVQITSGGSVNAGAGSIGGLPSGTASVNFNPLTGSYTFLQATSSAAGMNVGPTTIRRTDVGVSGVTVIPAVSSTSWTLTLPVGVPAAQSVLSISSTGAVTNATPDATITLTSSQIQVANLGIQTGNIANNAVTLAKLASVNQVVTASCNNFTVPNDGNPHVVPNCTTLFTYSTLRPITISLQYKAGTAPWNLLSSKIEVGSTSALDIYFEVTGSFSGTFAWSTLSGGLTPVSSISAFVIPSTTGIISVSAYVKLTAGSVAAIRNACLVVSQY